ncbi:FAD binding domain-containing protein [Nocardioides terrisoli]|uniref:FAD binding domain-containing protein n=1 Tax=Nocardioides terrisoli TaxID=3388267 RepID=UPI00287B6154|nr:FAD binding domain-containing protein [Nocardioides marmorisolisilvae]
MKPVRFRYERPSQVADVVELLADNEDAKVIAGGQSLVPLLNLRLARPSVLVDIGSIPGMKQIEARPDEVRIGAGTTEQAILAFAAKDPALPGLIPAAVSRIGHFQIRSRGTAGGSLCHLDPSAEWPALVLTLDATMVAFGPRGERLIPAAEFIVGPLWSALELDEVLLEIRLPRASSGWGFAEVERRDGDFALVGAMANRVGGSWTVVAFATGGMPQRLTATEAALASGMDPSRAEDVAREELEVASDIHASADYRRAVGAKLTRKVIDQACA